MTPRFLLFKASAGSGKTYNLAMQYIALLVAKGEGEFRHTLAVTFTNKATAEMKERILEFLHEFWKGTAKEDDVEALRKLLRDDYHLTIPDEELKERCHKALWAILHDYGRFCVSTIDAFFQTVMRNMAHELGLNARLQADLDDKNVVELAVENMLENLRNDDQNTLPYVKNYIEQKLADGEQWDVRKELKEMAKLLFEEAYQKRSINPEVDKDFNMQNIAQFRKMLKDERDAAIKPLKKYADAFEDVLRDLGMDYEEVLNYSSYVRKFVEAMKAGEAGNDVGKYVQNMADGSTSILNAKMRKSKALSGYDTIFTERLSQLVEAHRQANPRVKSIDIAMRNLSPMGLLGAIDKEVTRLSNDRNRFMLARTPILLKRMVGNDDASFVFERIGTTYNNIMIDEFQDTSQLQWENFRTLLVDNLASGGLSMVVGDIKQSIYRWRNGDWRILHGLEQEGYRGTPLIQKPLDTNYRSQGQIVKFNNEFFKLAPERLDQLSGTTLLADLYKEVHQDIDLKHKRENAGMVRIVICHSKDKEVTEAWQTRMLDDVCNQVEELHANGVAYNEMAFLLRKSKYITPLIQHFAQRLPHVQLVSDEAFRLGSSVSIGMLVGALQMVADRKRNPVAERYVAKHYLSDVLGRETSENDYLLPPTDDLLPEDFVGQLDELRRMPLYELCEQLVGLLSLNKVAGQEAYLFCFFDELSNYLRENPSDIPTFIKYWEEQMKDVAVPGGEADGIRILTIHKSKGLAFHTVLMPFAEWPIEWDMKDEKLWCRPSEAPLDAMGTIPVKLSSNKVVGTVFQGDYELEHLNKRADELNTLYVAFTRPKQNLLVWGKSKTEMPNNKTDETVADLMHQCLCNVPGMTATQQEDDPTLTTYTMGTIETKPLPKKADSGLMLRGAFEAGINFTFRQSSEAQEFVSKGDDEDNELQLSYLKQGKLLHYVFSQIHTANDIERVTRRLARQGILTTEAQVRQVSQLAHNGLRNPRVQDWFSGKYQLFNERNILVPREDGQLEKRRPDRVMMSPDRIIIVDFKFGRPEEEHQKQVARYIEILQDMYSQKRVEGWLWYVYKNKTEKVELKIE